MCEVPYFLERLVLERVEFAGAFLEPFALRAGVDFFFGALALGRAWLVAVGGVTETWEPPEDTVP
jgi:hypothetical protein